MIITSVDKNIIVNYNRNDAIWVSDIKDKGKYGIGIGIVGSDDNGCLGIGDYDTLEQAQKAVEMLTSRIEEAIRLNQHRVYVPTQDEL